MDSRMEMTKDRIKDHEDKIESPHINNVKRIGKNKTKNGASGTQ